MSEIIKYYDNITDRTVALLLEQFKTKENFIKFIEVLTQEYQYLENVFKEIDELTWLNTSSGIQLDRLGEIIGYRRESRNDDDFRDYLHFGILLNKSAGEPEFLITALKELTSGSFVRLYEIFPASCFGHTDGLDLPINIVTEMDDLALGGVWFLYVSQTDGAPFSFDSETVETGGFGFAWIDGGGSPVDEDGQFVWVLP